MAREAKGEAMAAGAPKEPLVEVKPGTDSVYNDPALIERMVKAVQGEVGPESVKEMPQKMTSEDFSQYGLQPGVKAVLLHVGAVDAARLDAAKKAGQPLRGTHSPQWAPDFKPTVVNHQGRDGDFAGLDGAGGLIDRRPREGGDPILPAFR